MRWIATEATIHGHAAAAGAPTSGTSGPAATAAPIEITTVAARGSSPFLTTAFQPAWQAAANSTAVNTKESMGYCAALAVSPEAKGELLYYGIEESLHADHAAADRDRPVRGA